MCLWCLYKSVDTVGFIEEIHTCSYLHWRLFTLVMSVIKSRAVNKCLLIHTEDKSFVTHMDRSFQRNITNVQ